MEPTLKQRESFQEEIPGGTPPNLTHNTFLLEATERIPGAVCTDEDIREMCGAESLFVRCV